MQDTAQSGPAPVTKDRLTLRLADILRDLRLKSGWSLDELATRSGVSRATLSRMENADVSPSALALSRVAKAHGLPVSRLIRLAEEETCEKIAFSAQAATTDPDTGMDQRLISAGAGLFSIDIREHVLPPGRKGVELAGARGGAEHQMLVLEGRLKVSRGGTVYVLRKGDVFRFHDDDSTTVGTGGKRAARYLLISN